MIDSREWQALSQYFEHSKNTKLEELFNQDTQRGLNYALEACGIYMDFSKNHLDNTSLKLLFDYLDASNLTEKRKALFSGEKINQSENRAALHTALRDINNEFQIDSKTHEEIHQSRKKMLALAEALNAGKLRNEKGVVFENLVFLGIGGSYLGPKLAIKALQSFHQTQLGIHFIASLDSFAFNKVMSKINPARTMFVIASKSFSTIETLSNAEQIKQLLTRNGITNTEKHFIAITSNTEKAKTFPCDDQFILDMNEAIGGRFSLWSSMGFPIAIAIGTNNFLDLLVGAHELDKHFYSSEKQHNLPVMLALIAFWYQNFFKANTRAIIPYSHALKLFPAFLQQLEMESLGKSINITGDSNPMETGAIIWGSEGPNSQHSFHQLLMQGKHFIPCDFIAINSNKNSEQHQLLLSQCIAQSHALAFGDKNKEAQKFVAGNQASNTLLLEELTPKTLGALLALYEHKVFVQALLMNINAFDQWGVELGKQITSLVQEQLNNKSNLESKLDSSSLQLLKKINKAD